MKIAKLVAALTTVMILSVLSIWAIDVYTVQGHEIGVLETWSDGVVNEPLSPKTYVFFPGFTKKLYTYDTSSQVFVMNDLNYHEESGIGRNQDSYLVQSREGQDMHISMNVRWKLDPTKIVELHKSVRGEFEEKLIRPVLMRVVKDEATTMDAISAYSGEGLVTLQNDIFKRLVESELADRGIVVENFVIEHIKLDPQYIEEIKLRQVAVQRELRATQEEKAALAEAQKAKAEAQADYERKVVEAERDKAVGVLNAEKEAETQILKADAEKQAGILRAESILALGKAEAEAKRLQLEAYNVEGADSYVQIEVSKSMAEAYKNISGYLPESMKVNVLTESFNKGVKAVVGVQE